MEELLHFNENDIKSPEAVKLILEILKQKFTLKEIIDIIISETIKKKNEKEINNYNNNKPNDINVLISFICKKIGSLRMLKCILDTESKEDEKDIRETKLLNKKKKENKYEKNKIFSLPSTVEEELNEMNNINNYIDNNIINLEEEENNKDIICLTDSDDENKYINIEDSIFSFNENEKYNNKIKKELEIKKISIKKNKDDFSFHKINSTEKFGITENNRLINKIKNLSYHCSIINGIYFKYKFKSMNKKGIAKFVCFNPKCEGYGIYNINNKMFTLLKEHNSTNDKFCSVYMDNFDEIYYSYMKLHNIEEMQIINN